MTGIHPTLESFIAQFVLLSVYLIGSLYILILRPRRQRALKMRENLWQICMTVKIQQLESSSELITIIFSIALAVIFAVWYKTEKTLSIHSIYTTRRETFYWLAILFTFALGTAAGDLVAETFELGYLVSTVIFGALIAVIAVTYLKFKLNAVLAFWLAYILTRPLGASIGDYLSQPLEDGGLGLGTVVTSALFLMTILATVIYLTTTKKDAPRPETSLRNLE